ncbi:MAG: hypothetical protein ACQEQO_09670 [Thermodesulfobacteriota bacterium]
MNARQGIHAGSPLRGNGSRLRRHRKLVPRVEPESLLTNSGRLMSKKNEHKMTIELRPLDGRVIHHWGNTQGSSRQEWRGAAKACTTEGRLR